MATWKKIITEDSKLDALSATTSAEFRSVISDESGTGVLIFAGGNIAAGSASTQASSDNSTKIATTAYADTQAALGDITLANTKIWIGSVSGAKAEKALSGDVSMTATGAVTVGTLNQNTTGTSGGLTGAPDITVGAVTASSASISGNLTVSGTTTTINTANLLVEDKLILMANATAKSGQTSTILLEDRTVTLTGSSTTDGYMVGMTVTQSSGTGTLPVGTITAVTDSTHFENSLAATVSGSCTFALGGPTALTADGGGIQIEASATEADYPEIKWARDKGGINTDGAGTKVDLTGWTVSNMHTSNPIDVPISVMEFGIISPTLGSVKTFGSVTSTGSNTSGNYTSVSLSGGTGSGVTVNATVAVSGSIQITSIASAGSGYSSSDTLTFPGGSLGNGSDGATVPVNSISRPNSGGIGSFFLLHEDDSDNAMTNLYIRSA